jgi:multimeric flavodoxin WrbA
VKKNIFILFGSPRKNGYTAKLLTDFISKINFNFSFNIINSYQENIKPCTGCNFCKNNKETCIYKDFDHINSLIKESDLIIISSPVYNLSFPAPLKAIFDRMQPYFIAKFIKNEKINIKNKIGIALLTCGSNSEDGFFIINKQLKLIFNLINTEFLGKVTWKNTDKINNFYSKSEFNNLLSIINTQLNLQ